MWNEIKIISIMIINQIDKFLKSSFFSELHLKKFGNTKIKTAINAIAGTICSRPII